MCRCMKSGQHDPFLVPELPTLPTCQPRMHGQGGNPSPVTGIGHGGPPPHRPPREQSCFLEAVPVTGVLSLVSWQAVMQTTGGRLAAGLKGRTHQGCLDRLCL
jgi:hypothetical protein